MSDEFSAPADTGRGVDYEAFEHHTAQMAVTIKEHDFDKMGYDAGVVAIYANAYARHTFPAPPNITKEQAEAALNNSFKALYGKTPAEYRQGMAVKLRTPYGQGHPAKEPQQKITRNRLVRDGRRDKDRGR